MFDMGFSWKPSGVSPVNHSARHRQHQTGQPPTIVGSQSAKLKFQPSPVEKGGSKQVKYGVDM